MLIIQVLILILVGFLIGIAAGFVGASAVSLVVPILYVFFQFDILMALGTSLLVDIIGASIVAFLYWKRGNTNIKMGLLLGIISFTFAIIGSFIAFMMAFFSENVLSGAFGWFNIIIGILLIRNGYKAVKMENKEKSNTTDVLTDDAVEETEDATGLKRPQNRFTELLDRVSPRMKNLILITISVFIGLNAGIFGAGGGFLITVILMFILDYPPLKAVGTATFIMIMTASGAFLSYYVRFGLVVGPASQFIILSFALIIGICSLIGGFLGTAIAHKISENYLKIILGVIIILFAFVMLAQTWVEYSNLFFSLWFP
ncbi:MAG: sulfite exporter TauE/SafE family protein [Candidatus Helarchaeota archaeon]